MAKKAEEKIVDLDGAPVATDDVGLEPDKSFLTNPTDDTEVKMQEFDDTYMSDLSPDRRQLSKEAREILRTALQHFSDSVDAISIVDGAFRYRDTVEQVFLTGKLTIKLTPRANMVSSRHMKQYLDKLQQFEGSAAELSSQIAQDLLMILRPQKVSVTFQSTEAGLKVKAQKTHSWKLGFTKS